MAELQRAHPEAARQLWANMAHSGSNNAQPQQQGDTAQPDEAALVMSPAKRERAMQARARQAAGGGGGGGNPIPAGGNPIPAAFDPSHALANAPVSQLMQRPENQGWEAPIYQRISNANQLQSNRQWQMLTNSDNPAEQQQAQRMLAHAENQMAVVQKYSSAFPTSTSASLFD